MIFLALSLMNHNGLSGSTSGLFCDLPDLVDFDDFEDWPDGSTSLMIPLDLAFTFN